MDSNENLAARIDELQREIHEKQAALTQLKREYRAPIGEYGLIGPDGATVSLADVFGDRHDMIVVHNMGRRCPYCTLWADGLNGLYNHLADRARFIVVSPDPPDVQRKFAASRGWSFPMYSDRETTFTRDMGYIETRDGTNYWWPGYSTFHRHEDGSIELIAHDSFGPGDPYCGLWHMFDLLLDGPNDWQPSFTYDATAQFASTADS